MADDEIDDINLPANIDWRRASLPATYKAAKAALAECVRVDECQDWADKMAALASYARQIKDDEMEKLARRIRARALRRCGEILHSIPSQSGGDRRSDQRGAGPTLITRTEAARDAGLSRDQRITVLRIDNVPRKQFETLVESDNPPTSTRLEQLGTQSRDRVLSTADFHAFNRERQAKAIIQAVLDLGFDDGFDPQQLNDEISALSDRMLGQFENGMERLNVSFNNEKRRRSRPPEPAKAKRTAKHLREV